MNGIKVRRDIELQPLLDQDLELATKADAKQQQTQSKKTFSTALLVVNALAWIVVSNSTILVNRYFMVELAFAYPITISCFGMVVTSIASFLVVRVFKLVEAKQEVSWPVYSRCILPITILAASSLFTSNMAYLYLTVSFIQILKAATPILTMLALFLMGLETPCPRLVASVLVVCAGTVVATYGELHMSFVGLMLMAIAEVGEAMRLALTQWLLTGLEFHPMEALMYMSPAVALWLILGLAIFELPSMLQTKAYHILLDNLPLCFAASGLGFGVNILTLSLINLSSSLSVKILGVVRNISLVGVGIAVLGEIVTALEVVGYSISLVGLLWYNIIKFTPTAQQ